MTRGKYTLQRRAESMVETRRQIAQAALDLHATVGPAAATISAIAARAGVQRQTVYRHFPDDLSLFRACVTHGLETSPRPDPSRWTGIGDPEERLRAGLRDLYGYYRRNESLWANVTRDLPSLPALQQANADAGVFDWFASIREILLRPWRVRGRRKELLRAAIGHAAEFSTWYSLTRRQGLGDEDAVEAIVSMARCITASRS